MKAFPSGKTLLLSEKRRVSGEKRQNRHCSSPEMNEMIWFTWDLIAQEVGIFKDFVLLKTLIMFQG